MFTLKKEFKDFFTGDKSMYYFEDIDKTIIKVPCEENIIGILGFPGKLGLNQSGSFVGVYNKKADCLFMSKDDRIAPLIVKNQKDDNDVEDVMFICEIDNEILDKANTLLLEKVQPTDDFKDLRKKALSMLHDKSAVKNAKMDIIYSLSYYNDFHRKCTVYDLIEICKDKDAFINAYVPKLVEKVMTINPAYLQNKVNLVKALEFFGVNPPYNYAMEDALEEVLEHTRKVTVELRTKDEPNGTMLYSQDTSLVKSLPIYAINKVIHKNKVVYNVDSFEKDKVEALRKNVEYNLELLKSCVLGYYSHSMGYMNVLDCFDEDMFNNKEFDIIICSNATTADVVTVYNKYIPLKFKEDADFVLRALGSFSHNIITKCNGRDFILSHQDEFIKVFKNLLTRNLYINLDELVSDEDFVCRLLKEFHEDAIPFIFTESLNLSDKVIECMKQNINYVPLNVHNRAAKKWIPLIKDKELLLKIVTRLDFGSLPDDIVNDRDFMDKVLDKATMQLPKPKTWVDDTYMFKNNGFFSFFDCLQSLKTDVDLIAKAINLLGFTDTDISIISKKAPSLLNEEKIQEGIINKLPYCINVADCELARKKTLEEPDKYLSSYLRSSISERFSIDELVTIAKNLTATTYISSLYPSMIKLKIEDLKKLVDINPYFFVYTPGDHKVDIAKYLVYEKNISILPYCGIDDVSILKEDNRDILRKCLEISPNSYRNDAIRATLGPDMETDAVMLNSDNIVYIYKNSKVRKDKEIALKVLLEEPVLSDEFSKAIFGDKEFLAKLYDKAMEVEDPGKRFTLKSNIKAYITPLISRKVLDNAKFVEKYNEYI
jgi:hypothetical protein